jgi:transcriptional regulator with XRE-family HTH domain
LRDARSKVGIPQDKLGVLIGMDESSSSARISRYETGTHEPPFATAASLAAALCVPVAYFYCDDDRLADLLIVCAKLGDSQIDQLVARASELSESSAMA